jgi:hypothetical protein
VKPEVIPVTIRATGTVSKSFKIYLNLNDIPRKHKIKELQKQPCWALHAYCRKYYCESTEHSAWEITLHVP